MKKQLIVIWVMVFLLGCSQQSNNSEKTKLIKEKELTDELIKKGYNLIKKTEENKAFADLMFGDDISTVKDKMLKDSKFRDVSYSTEEYGNLRAELNIQDAIFIMYAKFNEGKLYKIALKGLLHRTYYLRAKSEFDILFSLVKEQYGPPDYATDTSAYWICGKKTVRVWISLGGLASLAGCDIYETSVEAKINEKEEEIKKQKIQEDAKSF